MSSEGLLYSNRFFQPETDVQKVAAIRSRERDAFRSFVEKLQGNPLLATSSALPASTDALESHQITETGAGGHKQTTRTSRSKIICIDSRDRDYTLYPDPSTFRLYLSETFDNIRLARLVSTEFPNTEQLIKSQPASKKNNKLYWINGPEELDAGEEYSISITPGNYTVNTLATEIMTKTAAVPRIFPTSSNGPIYHNFDVVVDNITNEFIIRQNTSTTLNNPISTTAGSSVVTVAQDEHGLLPGQIVNISGSSKVGGVPADTLNASQVISVDIARVDDLTRDGTSQQTLVTYNISTTQLQGRVVTTTGSDVIYGRGTAFLSAVDANNNALLAPGTTLTIGYNTYTIRSIQSDACLTIEERCTESFNEYTLIDDILPGDTNGGVEVDATDSTKTLINTVNNKLRNINYFEHVSSTGASTALTELAEDSAYETSHALLSLNNFVAAQTALSIYTPDLSRSVLVAFDNRDPTYTVFNQFSVCAGIQNFNLVTTTASTSGITLTANSGPTPTTVTLPTGTSSTLDTLLFLQGSLPGWTVAFDSVDCLYYFKPPTGTLLTYKGTSYESLTPYSLTMTGSQIGLPGSTGGTVVMSDETIDASSVITVDPAYNQMDILDSNNISLLPNPLTLSYTMQFASVAALADAINTIILTQQNAPPSVTVIYKQGLNRVVIAPTASAASNFGFSVVFQQAPAGTNSLAAALGFTSTVLQSNACIRSSTPVKNYLNTGYYTHPFLDTINAVPHYLSRALRGMGVVQNTSSLLQGYSDVYDFPSVIGTAPSGVLTGNVSGRQMTVVTSLPSVTNPVAGDTYMTPPSSLPMASLEVAAKDYDCFVVTLTTQFVFTRRSDGKSWSGVPLELEYDRCYVFDLRALLSSCSFKLSRYQNGAWTTNASANPSNLELLDLRRYMLNGQFMQLCVPSTDATDTVLYYYDDLSNTTVQGIPAATSSTYTFQYSKATFTAGKTTPSTTLSAYSAPYIQIASPLMGTQTALSFSQTPVLQITVGNIYILDYTSIGSPASKSGIAADVLKLSTTIDGEHFVGYDLTSTPTGYLKVTATTITVDLTGSGPFPDRLYYYLEAAKGAGGTGYIEITYPTNSGTILLRRKLRARYDTLLSGGVVATTVDPSLVPAGSVLAYSPYHGLSGGKSIAVMDLALIPATNNTEGEITRSFTVTLGNNCFNLLQEVQVQGKNVMQTIATITITDANPQPQDIVTSVLPQLNSATSGSATWNIIYNSTASTFTFTVTAVPGTQLSIYELAFNDTVNEITPSLIVTLDNNRFNLLEEVNSVMQTIATITITDTNPQPQDIVTSVLQQLTSATLGATWNMVFDSTASTFTFTVTAVPGTQLPIYGFGFSGYGLNDNVDLYNSAAELLGFSQKLLQAVSIVKFTGKGTTTASITSTSPVDLQQVGLHTFTVPSAQIVNTSLTDQTELRWSELLVNAGGTVSGSLIGAFQNPISGTRFTTDLVVGDQLLIGTDLDQVFTVTSITDDHNVQLDSGVTINPAVTDPSTGLITPAPTETLYFKLYKVTNLSTQQFQTNDKTLFYMNTQAKSTYDYNGGLAGLNHLVTRTSPLKFSIVETDRLLDESLVSDALQYTSIKNHNLYYVANNSRYHFTVASPATSNAVGKGGNPVQVGTGVKFWLDFTGSDTPGELLGFPNVGAPLVTTEPGGIYHTVQSNTIEDTATLVDILRTVPGTGNMSGTVQVVTTTPHNFEYGDTVFITDHSGSSNDLAVNNDEGYTVTVVSSALTIADGAATRGVFYIPLVLAYGGTGGMAFKKKLNKPFDLSGENYLYLLCPTFSSLSTTTSAIQNPFAKIRLNAPPGSVLFNSFVSSDKVFDDAPLSTLEYLDLQVVDYKGLPFDFVNSEWSASIEVIWDMSTPSGIGQSSRTNLLLAG